jgi:hypothetical protein
VACDGSFTSKRALGQFRNYGGLIKIARCGFPWKKTTESPIASVYTNCETALAGLAADGAMMVAMVMMMVRLRKCGSRKHQDHGEKQSLFHVQIITTKGRRACRFE